jgi:hypothetical protein
LKPFPQDHSAVDSVYLWVNGNDSHWRSKRLAASKRASPQDQDDLAVFGDVEGRYRDNEELRFSLRALAYFFPAHGHVYIVTDQQVPAWLALSAKVSIIDHRDLIPHAALPTFDSSHIESYIHRIPGLSERFFYFNDDVFFGAPVHLADWFSPTGVYLAWSDDAPVSNEPLRRDATSLENACRLSAQWLSTQGSTTVSPAYTHTPRTFAHSPRPLRKSLLWKLEKVAPEMFERVRSTVFRNWDCPTIVSDFVLRWALAHNMAQVRDYRHTYVSIGDGDAGEQLSRLARHFGALDFFCVNDTTDNAQGDDPRLAHVRRALQAMLPHASKFELSNQRLEAPQDQTLAIQ